MSSDEMFESTLRSAGDLAGVFEHDGETSYFYLYDLQRAEEQKILGAIRVAAGPNTFDQVDLDISWNDSESVVGLFIKGTLWAAFDGRSHDQFGGNLDANGKTTVPDTILKTFS